MREKKRGSNVFNLTLHRKKCHFFSEKNTAEKTACHKTPSGIGFAGELLEINLISN
jgi:hypothetical protein